MANTKSGVVRKIRRKTRASPVRSLAGARASPMTRITDQSLKKKKSHGRKSLATEVKRQRHVARSIGVNPRRVLG